MNNNYSKIIKKYFQKENFYYRVVKEVKTINFGKITIINDKLILHLNSNWGEILISLSKDYPFTPPDIFINYYSNSDKKKIIEIFLKNTNIDVNSINLIYSFINYNEYFKTYCYYRFENNSLIENWIENWDLFFITNWRPIILLKDCIEHINTINTIAEKNGLHIYHN